MIATKNGRFFLTKLLLRLDTMVCELISLILLKLSERVRLINHRTHPHNGLVHQGRHRTKSLKIWLHLIVGVNCGRLGVTTINIVFILIIGLLDYFFELHELFQALIEVNLRGVRQAEVVTRLPHLRIRLRLIKQMRQNRVLWIPRTVYIFIFDWQRLILNSELIQVLFRYV